MLQEPVLLRVGAVEGRICNLHLCCEPDQQVFACRMPVPPLCAVHLFRKTHNCSQSSLKYIKLIHCLENFLNGSPYVKIPNSGWVPNHHFLFIARHVLLPCFTAYNTDNADTLSECSYESFL